MGFVDGFAAVARAGFHWKMLLFPFRHPASVNKKFCAGNFGIVPQHERCVLARVAFAAPAINDDLFRGLAGGQNLSNLVSGIIVIKVVRSGDVRLFIFLRLAHIDENDQSLLVSRVIEQLPRLGRIQRLQPFFFQAGGHLFLDWNGVRCPGDGRIRLSRS